MAHWKDGEMGFQLSKEFLAGRKKMDRLNAMVHRWVQVDGIEGHAGWWGQERTTNLFRGRYADRLLPGRFEDPDDAAEAVRKAHRLWRKGTAQRKAGIPRGGLTAAEHEQAFHERGFVELRSKIEWQRVNGMYVEAERGIVIEKRGPRWHWSVEAGAEGFSGTLKAAKAAALRGR